MLNRLKEITLFKVKFPLRCKLHYFASLFFFHLLKKGIKIEMIIAIT